MRREQIRITEQLNAQHGREARILRAWLIRRWNTAESSKPSTRFRGSIRS